MVVSDITLLLLLASQASPTLGLFFAFFLQTACVVRTVVLWWGELDLAWFGWSFLKALWYVGNGTFGFKVADLTCRKDGWSAF